MVQKNTIIGLAAGVLLGESLKEILQLAVITPIFGTSPGLAGYTAVFVVSLILVAQFTDRYGD